MTNRVKNLLHEDDAATAVEYAVMLALILLVCIGGIALVGQTISSSYDNSATELLDVFNL